MLTLLLGKNLILPCNLNLASLTSFMVATGGWATWSFIKDDKEGRLELLLRCDDMLLCSCSLETGPTTRIVGFPSVMNSL